MHVQPEAKKVRIGNRPLWAAGAPQMIEEFIAARGGAVSILEFGSGASTIFLLRRGATVTTVEHHDGWAEALQATATARKLAAKLTILRRDRPYSTVPAEFPEGTAFDILLVDGRERVDCLREALPLVKPDGLVLLDDSQRERYWPSFRLLADRESVTFRSAPRDTTIWSLGQVRTDPRFAGKRFERAEPVAEPERTAFLVPQEYPDVALDHDYIVREPIRDLGPVEARLQQIGLIEKDAAYPSPGVYRLADWSIAIDAGHKLLSRDGQVYRAKSGKFVPAEGRAVFDGAVALPGLTLDLSSSGAGRYSFFLLDLLPKLDLLAAAGHGIDDFDTILINTGAPWARAMLDHVLGPGERNVVAFSGDRPSFHMERSVHFEGLRSARFTPRWIHDFVDRAFRRDAAREGSESFGPFVYISRQRASGRRILNHDAFLGLIEPLGFTEVFAEDHPPEELAERLRDARVLISPHGAGLVNAVLAPPTCEVIELFSSHYTPQYLHLARDRGQRYRAIAGVDAEGRNVFDRYTAETRNRAEFNREDIVVPIAELEAILAPTVHAGTPAGPAPAKARRPVQRPSTDTVFGAGTAEAPRRRWSLARLFGRR